MGHQLFAEPVFVTSAGGLDAALVPADRLGKKAGLREHSIRSTIVLRIPRQALLEKLLEARDVARLAAKLIVEAQDLGHEPGSQSAAALLRQAGDEVEQRGGIACRRLHY